MSFEKRLITNMLSSRKIWIAFAAAFALFNLKNVHAQTSILGADNSRVVATSVPFINIAPDARASGMGDVGVATSPDANAVYWNPAKLSFIENSKYGFSLSYSPWLRNLVNDMSLSYLSGYYKLDDQQAIGVDLRYFNLGDIEFTDVQGFTIRNFTPREIQVGVSYSRKLSNTFGMAISGMFIHSNLSANLEISNQQEAKPGISGGASVSAYYNKEDLQLGGTTADLSFGANISNIGAKISYTNSSERDFIPTNLRLGSAFTVNLDPMERNKLTIALDVNKLLVPSPPIRDADNNIIDGVDPKNTTVLSGIFGSFSDAPGGFSEEMKEFIISTGLEYKYHNEEGVDVFAARAGYFNENDDKGGRKYFSIGAGFKYAVFGLDVAYLIPQSQNNPLAETLRFSVSFNFADRTN